MRKGLRGRRTHGDEVLNVDGVGAVGDCIPFEVCRSRRKSP